MKGKTRSYSKSKQILILGYVRERAGSNIFDKKKSWLDIKKEEGRIGEDRQMSSKLIFVILIPYQAKSE